MQRLAQGIAYVFHPLLGASYLAALLAWLAPAVFDPLVAEALPLFVAIVVLLTMAIPALAVLTLRATGLLPHLHMNQRAERPLPFALIFAFYLLTALLLGYRFGFMMGWVKLQLILAGLVGVLLVVTLRFKVSIHCALAGGLPGLLLAVKLHHPEAALTWPLAASFAIGGLVISSRLYLSAHNEDEAYWGTVAGFLLTFVPSWLWF